MIERASKYVNPRQAAARKPATFGIIVPDRRKVIALGDWFFKELREGGFLKRYVDAEKAELPKLIRATAIRERNFVQNNKSEWRRMASIPGRLYHRWLAEDPDFWKDRKNLKSLKRDNPELAIWN